MQEYRYSTTTTEARRALLKEGLSNLRAAQLNQVKAEELTMGYLGLAKASIIADMDEFFRYTKFTSDEKTRVALFQSDIKDFFTCLEDHLRLGNSDIFDDTPVSKLTGSRSAKTKIQTLESLGLNLDSGTPLSSSIQNYFSLNPNLNIDSPTPALGRTRPLSFGGPKVNRSVSSRDAKLSSSPSTTFITSRHAPQALGHSPTNQSTAEDQDNHHCTPETSMPPWNDEDLRLPQYSEEAVD
ncbi:hypothetical protein IAR55_007198 [Kwoniella newhampshirensis]|uniref:Uncharacterized protein n=1 Tax=Kwoniella newhampshirensis TaxID=1651941 RepID=A0AAW0YHE2_9TREE